MTDWSSAETVKRLSMIDSPQTFRILARSRKYLCRAAVLKAGEGPSVAEGSQGNVSKGRCV
jgi:hypothetical protein